MDYEMLWNQLKQKQLDGIRKAPNEGVRRDCIQVLTQMNALETRAYFDNKCREQMVVLINDFKEEINNG